MTTTTALRPGTLVRLTIDQGPRSFGVVLPGDVTVRDDGTRVVPTAWTEQRDVADDLAYRIDADELVAVDHAGWPATDLDVYVLRLAELTLTPLCEHVDTFADEWGLACSEPGVPTSFDVPCRFDATRLLVTRDYPDPADMPFNLCDAHAAMYRADLTVVSDDAI